MLTNIDPVRTFTLTYMAPSFSVLKEYIPTSGRSVSRGKGPVNLYDFLFSVEEMISEYPDKNLKKSGKNGMSFIVGPTMWVRSKIEKNC